MSAGSVYCGIFWCRESYPVGALLGADAPKVRREDYVRPTFVREVKGEPDLDVRLNNLTRLLNTADALDCVRSQ